MATRAGSFGKLPKAAPDLSATIAALLAEYMAQVDQNMVDAWRNGGEVDNKPVTDSRLLKHFKQRRDELDRKDPDWQMWDNRILQYEFSIEESKMSVKWDNGQASERDMAAFYRKWEKKTPDNTEFDRSLRRSYGQWMKSANAKTAASNAQARIDAHNAWANKFYDKHVKVADTANAWLSDMLFNWGILPGHQENGKQVPPSNITGLEANSDTDFETLLALVQGGSLSPEQQADVDAFTKGMKKLDPDFNWSMDWFNGASQDALDGIHTLKKKSLSDAEKNAWAVKGGNIKATNNRIKAAPAVEDLKDARALLEERLAASHGNPDLQRAALEDYLAVAEGVAARLDRPGSFKNPSSYDTGIVPGLNAEIDVVRRGLAGEDITGELAPTWMDSTAGTTADSGSDGQSWGDLLNGMNDNANKIADGGWAVASEDANGDLQFTYHGMDEAPPIGLTRVGGYGGAGQGIVTYVAPKPVYGVTLDSTGAITNSGKYKTNAEGQMLDKDGNVTDDPAQAEVVPNPVLYSTVTLPNENGGEPITWRVIPMPDGTTVRVLDPPLDPESGAREMQDGEGNTVVGITQTPEESVAGVPFDPTSVLSYGKTTNGQGGPRPMDEYERDANGNKTGFTVPGAYMTDSGVQQAARLASLDINDPNYRADRKQILDGANNLQRDLTYYAFRAGEQGDQATMEDLNGQATAAANDYRQLMVLATAQAAGDTTSVGLTKTSALLAEHNATWNGTDILVNGGSAVGAATSQNQRDQALGSARQWALTQLDNYDKAFNWSNPWSNAGAAPENLSPGSDFGVLGGSMTGSDALLHNTQYGSLREQITKTQDPRELKLPAGVGTGNNPFLTAILPTTPTTGTGVPTGPAAGPTAAPPPAAAPPAASTPPAAPPANPIPQPPAPKPPANTFSGSAFVGAATPRPTASPLTSGRYRGKLVPW